MDPQDLPPGLYLVSTPLGHLKDLTPRAREVLSRASHWAAESRDAAQRWKEILRDDFVADSVPHVLSYREASRDRDSQKILALLENGAVVALLSDAGTPTISDPGWQLVDLARQSGHPIYAAPGPCAAILALSMSGFPCRRFSFEGFLPASGRHRRETLDRLCSEEAPIIFYESPHRLLKTLEEISEIFTDRDLFVGRELTKKFEECWRGPISQAHEVWKDRRVQGEFTLVVGPRPPKEDLPRAIPPESLELLSSLALPTRTTSAILKHFFPDISKKELYALSLQLKPKAETQS